MPTLNLQPKHLGLLLKVLDDHVPDAEIWAYGSRTNGQAHETSDLDLVLRHPEQLNEPEKNLSALRDALSESDIPILVEILDWARLPEEFRREIERCHVVIRPAGKEAVR